MDESDDELFNRNVPNYPKEVMVFGVKGPHINMSNVPIRRNFNSRNQPSFSRPRYAGSCVDERYRRGLSPMSVRSAFDIPGNCRPGSPLSMRNTESTPSATTTQLALAFHNADIDFEFKNVEFNMSDYDLIKVTYEKFMRKRARYLSKTRGLKILDRRCRANVKDISRGSSSDFSNSDTDDESQRRNNHNIAPSNRSTKSLCIRPNVWKNNIDTTNNHNPITFGNISSIPLEKGSNITQQPQINDHLTSIHPEFANISKKSNNAPIMPKDRFKKGFALPCQRFNLSAAIHGSNENSCNNESTVANAVNNKHVDNGTGSDQEQCLANGSPESNISGNKRKHDDVDGVRMSEMKKMKPSTKHSNTNSSTRNDFNFAKPKFPVRKFTKTKKNETTLISSTLLSKSVTDKELQQSKNTQPHKDPLHDNELENNESMDDVSTRPSFIKRKLFTQKLELAEKKNLSTGSIQSPQIEQWRKERTKPRKYTSNQLCLTSLDSNKENNNLKDLIQKIVPAEDSIINKTNATDNSKANIIQKASKKKNKSGKNAEDWDVASIISTCDVDEASDTYTDEEIFNVNKKSVPAPKESKKQECARPVSKNTVIDMTSTEISENCLVSQKTTKNNVAPKTIVTQMKSFWDTDIDTDCETSPKTLFNNNRKTVDATKRKEITLNQGNAKLSTMSNDLEEVTNAKTKQNGDNMSIKTSNPLKSLRVRLDRTPKRRLCCDDESKTDDKGPSPNYGSDTKIKNKETKTKAVTSKKNAPVTCDSTLNDSDSFDLIYESKRLRTRTVNLSNSSIQNEIRVRKEKRVDIKNDPNNINKKQNAELNKVKGKKLTNRTLLTSSVKTRRSRALSATLDI